MLSIGSYKVQVTTPSPKRQLALVAPSQKCKMPNNWDFMWQEFWNNTNFELEGIISLTLNGTVLGLVKYSSFSDQKPLKAIFIGHLEALPANRDASIQRIAKPVGRWLIWYVARVALQKCLKDENSPYIVLVNSVASAFDYYRDIIGMEYIGPAALGPDEDGYAFGFSAAAAANFCKAQEKRYGLPKRIQETVV